MGLHIRITFAKLSYASDDFDIHIYNDRSFMIENFVILLNLQTG